MTLITRHIVQTIKDTLQMYPILALTGPRQSGKTTLLKELFPDFRYISLENPDNRNFASTDPNGFLEEFHSKVIFDEVQRVPELFSYLQSSVDDRNREMGLYVLSGSQNFHLMHSITQSLAGRVAIFKLFPLDFNEMKGAKLMEDDFIDLSIKGFYPGVYDRNIPPKVFYSNYIETYLNRDIGELVAIRDLKLFQNFIALCATRAGQLLNLNGLANDCGISQPTAKAWLSALDQSYITFQLHPYYKNYSKRIIKTPKLYFYDTGLLCYLLKINSREKLIKNPIKGAVFENMMIAEYVKQMHHQNNVQDIWYWRDVSGNEVDLLVDHGENLEIIEFKATQTIKSDMFDGLSKFESISQLSNLDKKLVYSGTASQNRSMGKLISWKDFGLS
ncbi:MAG: ATP-binding protein [Cecembia sp.]